jgi:hypothetical protein
MSAGWVKDAILFEDQEEAKPIHGHGGKDGGYFWEEYCLAGATGELSKVVFCILICEAVAQLYKN